MLSFWLIPPGVLHLYCVIVVVNGWRVEDDDDDMATEVQTNFYHSQYYTMITTKSKIKTIIIHMISYILNECIPCCFPSLWSLILLLLLHCNLSNVSSDSMPSSSLFCRVIYFTILGFLILSGIVQNSIKNTLNLIHSIVLVRANSVYFGEISSKKYIKKIHQIYQLLSRKTTN